MSLLDAAESLDQLTSDQLPNQKRVLPGLHSRDPLPATEPPYPAEFRQQFIDLVQAGRLPAERAREFGCTAQTTANWVARSAIDRGKPLPGKDGLTSAEREESSRLRRESRQIEIEREILSKATAWFAGRGDKTYTPSSSA